MSSGLTALPDMTLEEFTVKHGALKSMDSAMRVGLLEIRDRNGWKAGGFASWADYGEKEWNYDQRHLNRLATAAHIQNIVRPMGLETIPERQLRPLTTIDDAEKKQVFDDAVEKAREEGKKLGAKHVEEAVNEWKSKFESTQNDLIYTAQQAEELRKKVNFQAMTVESVTKQNDDLRNLIDVKVSQGISEARAALIQENHDAIAQVERDRDNAKHELERLKREQEKAIKDGVTRELSQLDRELDLKQSQIDNCTKRIESLRDVELSLEREVGVLQTHKKAIEKIKDNLSFLTVSFSDVFDTTAIPSEVTGEWDAIFYAVSKLKKQMAEWRDQYTPLESTALVGELVD
jgi:hypothetical protein